MKTTVNTGIPFRPWDNVRYPIVIVKAGEVAVAEDKCTGYLLTDSKGHPIMEHVSAQSGWWEKAGWVPATKPVTITFEN